ncbi:putative caspase-like protein [Bradyrhizobium sp. LM3.4]
MIPFRLFALLILAIGLACGPAHADRRVALVIGNSAYKSAPKLGNPVNDATLVGGMFKKAGFDSVDVRLDLSASEMRRMLREFAGRTRDADVAVIYYAGHGIELEGTNYLIPTDATLETDGDVLDETIPVERALFAVEPAKQLRLIILDACRDNPFSKTMKRTLASRAIGRGLAKVEPTSPNTMIAFAAKAGSTASDGDSKNSPFAVALVEHLPKPGLDLRKAFGFVRDDVLKSTGYKQEAVCVRLARWRRRAIGCGQTGRVWGAGQPAGFYSQGLRAGAAACHARRLGSLPGAISRRFLCQSGQGPDEQDRR